jgi:hypothetical protein
MEQSDQFCGSKGTRTLFSIELTTGRARVIAKFSLVPSEAEVLLPPNSRFKVLGQLDAGNGLVIVQLKELPSRDPIIDFDAPATTAASVVTGGSAVVSSRPLSDLSVPDVALIVHAATAVPHPHLTRDAGGVQGH